MIERKPAAEGGNTFTVSIMGDEYIIKGNDSPEYMQEIAGYLEKTIEAITANNQKLNKCQTAVLAALKITDELYKLRQKYH